MKIDKSKLTPEEVTTLDALVAKAGAPDMEPAQETAEKPEPEQKSNPNTEAVNTETVTPKITEKSAPNAPESSEQTDTEDIYKGLHPAVAAELRDLRKRADEAENRELLEIAKKYEILGKKPEELSSTLKGLKQAGNGAYDQMIAILDASVQAIEKAGVFKEIGRTGHGSSEAGGTVREVEVKAAALMKSRSELTRAQAIDEILSTDPELAKRYEEE